MIPCFVRQGRAKSSQVCTKHVTSPEVLIHRSLGVKKASKFLTLDTSTGGEEGTLLCVVKVLIYSCL